MVCACFLCVHVVYAPGPSFSLPHDYRGKWGSLGSSKGPPKMKREKAIAEEIEKQKRDWNEVQQQEMWAVSQFSRWIIWRPQPTKVCPSDDLKAQMKWSVHTILHVRPLCFQLLKASEKHAAVYRRILSPSAPAVVIDPHTCGRCVRVLLLFCFHFNVATVHNTWSVLYFPISRPSDLC